MKQQKLFYVPLRNYDKVSEVIEDDDLQELLDSGWEIKQINAFGYAQDASTHKGLVVLLEKE